MGQKATKNDVKDDKMLCRAEGNCRVGANSLWVYHCSHLIHCICIKILII